MTRFGGFVRVCTFGALLSGFCIPADAQNLTAGKTAAQLFSQTCQACHSRPQALGPAAANRSLESFLRQHYTSSREDAAALAAFVRGQPADPSPAAKGSRTVTPRPGLPALEAPAAARGPKSDSHKSDHVRIPDERAPVKGAKRPQKPEQSRPVFDTSPAPAVMPAIPPVAEPEPPKPAEAPAPAAQAPVMSEPAQPAPETTPRPAEAPLEPPAEPAPSAAPSAAPAAEGDTKAD